MARDVKPPVGFTPASVGHENGLLQAGALRIVPVGTAGLGARAPNAGGYRAELARLALH